VKRWRANDVHPVEVECEQRGYPYPCSDGEIQYENTHFDTEDEAWEKAQCNAEAYVSLAGSAVRDAEARLAKAREQAGDAAKFMKAYLDGRDKRERI
jgi:hypothetical protein